MFVVVASFGLLIYSSIYSSIGQQQGDSWVTCDQFILHKDASCVPSSGDAVEYCKADARHFVDEETYCTPSRPG